MKFLILLAFTAALIIVFGIGMSVKALINKRYKPVGSCGCSNKGKEPGTCAGTGGCSS